MKRILKYRLQPGPVSIYVGSDATILHVAFQPEYGGLALPTIWVLADPANSTPMSLYVALTGDSPPDDGEHVGTMVNPDGSMVLHVFRQVPS